MTHLTLDPDFFICCICQFEYDQVDRIPRMLPACGHTFCSNCLERLVENQNQLRCPLDQIFYPIQQENLHQVPVNIVLKQMVEQRSKIKHDLCEVHEGELKNLVCLNDKCRVCKYCVDYGNHKNHHIKYIKDIQVDAESKRKELEGLLGEFDTYSNAMNELLRKDKDTALKMVKERFTALKSALNKQEQELLIRVNSLYDQRRHKRPNTETVRENAQFKKEIEAKIGSLKELKMDDMFFTALEEPKFKTPIRHEYEGLALQSQDFQFNLEEGLDDYHSTVITKMLETKYIRVELKQKQAVPADNSQSFFEKIRSMNVPVNTEKHERKSVFKFALTQQMPSKKPLASLDLNVSNFLSQSTRSTIKINSNAYHLYQDNDRLPFAIQSIALGSQFNQQTRANTLSLDERLIEALSPHPRSPSYASQVVDHSGETSENQEGLEMFYEDQEEQENEQEEQEQEEQEEEEGGDEGEQEYADENGNRSPVSVCSWFM